MKPNLRFLFLLSAFCLTGISAIAQTYAVKAVLQDSKDKSPLSFATAAISKTGDKNAKALAYTLSEENGSVEFTNLKPGNYTLKAELMGYKPFTKEFKIENADVNLGVLSVTPDLQQLDAAKVTDRGNPIQMKRDTIAFTSSTFKITENDMLEDLIKKIPGMEVSEDGSITHNGKTISKITIDGKTFFLNDPQIATKNLPAKIVDKLKVIEKKSDQAEFTGIDDGEEETILDLTVKPGMMKGSFGNLMGGGGHDIPSTSVEGDWRFQTAGFLGNFTDNYQISAVLNANNTNNRGFNDLAGSMMGGMRGGGGGMGRGQGGWGGGNGITTSYMAGVNGGTNLFDGKMDISGNGMFNHSSKSVIEDSFKETRLDDSSLLYDSEGNSNTQTLGAGLGMRLEHKFSENTSIIFEPRLNFGGGSFADSENTLTRTLNYDNPADTLNTNRSSSLQSGNNRSLSTSGFVLLRQKLGIPGRTLTLMGNYNISRNRIFDALNQSNTITYDSGGNENGNTPVNHSYKQESNSTTLSARATFTQPLAEKLFAEVNASYSWSESNSNKSTYDNLNSGALVDSYSNDIFNQFTSQTVGANLLYQPGEARFQLGFSLIPSQMHNRTNSGSSFQIDTTITRFNWSPQLMIYTPLGEDANIRFNYRGRSNTPSTMQLITVPDNSNPLAVSFGNPNLAPYFSHNLSGDFRWNNKKTYASVNARWNASYTQDPIVNASWYTNGIAYSMPVNGPSGMNVNFNIFANVPVPNTKFTFGNMTRVGWSRNSSYVGKDIDTDRYLQPDGSLDYEAFFGDYEQIRAKLEENRTNTFSVMERLRAIWRSDALELELSARTRMNLTDYTLASTSDRTTTWNNQIRANATWTWDQIGLSTKGEFNYNWYEGYSNKQPDEYVLNLEIQKLILNNKATVAVKGYDLLGQSKNLTVSDSGNTHIEAINNTLGRYIIVSFTYRFGNFDRDRMAPPHGPGGPGPRR